MIFTAYQNAVDVRLDTRRLDAFVKIVDLGSITRAAAILRIAQPALSQQIAGLEAEFKTQLLVRSTKGVSPTPAGLVLYRHALAIHKQLQEAQRTILESGNELSGSVALGLAPWSSASLIGPALLRTIRDRHPGILLHIYDIFGIAFSELTLRGRMDLSVLYGDTAPRGLHYRPVGTESFHFVARSGLLPGMKTGRPVGVEELAGVPMILPTEESFLRQMVERACLSAGASPQVVAEVYSMDMLSSALLDGIGATVLPHAVAASLRDDDKLIICPIEPALTMPISICIPDSAGLSDAAFTVHEIVADELSKVLG